MSRSIVLLLAGMAIGAPAAWWLHPSGEAQRELACPHEAVPAAARAALDARQLRLIMRDELSRALDGLPAPVARPEPQDAMERAPAVAAATPEQLQAFGEASGLVDAARSSGRWTKDADNKLKGLIAQLDEEERKEILVSLFSALNREQVVSDFAGPPLSR